MQQKILFYGGIEVKDYQDLIWKIIIAIAIIISGILISNALSAGFSNIHTGLAYMGGTY